MILAEDPVEYYPAGQKWSRILGASGQNPAVIGGDSTTTVRQKLYLAEEEAEEEERLAKILESVSLDSASKRIEILRWRKLEQEDSNKPSSTSTNETCADDEQEAYEELYASGKAATVTKGSNFSAPTENFSTDFRIIEAHWYKFSSSDERLDQTLGVNRKKVSPSAPEESWDSLCLFGENCLDVYEAKGQFFTTTLPFQMRAVWPTKFGFLLERRLSAQESETLKKNEEPLMPLMYTLSHPLNEVLPVIVKPQDRGIRQGARYACDLSTKVVFASLDPPIILSYSKTTGTHSLWLAKKATADEALSAMQRLEQSICSVTSCEGSMTQTPASVIRASFMTKFKDSTTTPSTSTNGGNVTSKTALTTEGTSQVSAVTGFATSTSSSGMLLSSKMQSSASGSSPSVLAVTPGPPRPGRGNVGHGQSPRAPISPAVSRLLGLNKLHQTPGNRFAALSPVPQSPLSAYQKETSPFVRLTRSRTTPHGHSLNQSFASSVSNVEFAPDSSHYWPAEPLIPDICLEWIWGESLKRGDSAFQAASKAFLTRDLSGQVYLCYLMPDLEQLKCLKINVRMVPQKKAEGSEEEEMSQRIVPGPLTTIPCRDASGFENSNLMLLVDTSNALQLYTGLHKLGPVHLNSSVLTSPNQKFDSANSSAESNGSYVLSSSRAHTPPGGSPAALDEMSLSPVTEPSLTETPLASAPGLVSGLGPACARSFVVHMLSGIKCISRLPNLTRSAWVSRCLEMVCELLPKDKSLLLYQTWFVYGKTEWSWKTGDPSVDELRSFFRILMQLMGFPVEKIEFFSEEFQPPGKRRKSSATSPMSLRKKQKPSDEGTDSDWEWLLNSDLHKKHKYGLRNALGLESERRDPTRGTEMMDLNKDASLFPNAAAIFSLLHLLYEESKLHCQSERLWKTWATCLYMISKSFQWRAYSDLYERDFSSLVLNGTLCRCSEEDLKLIHTPKSFSGHHNPGLFPFLMELLKTSEDFRIAPFLPVSSLTKGFCLLPSVLLCFAVLTRRARHPGDVDRILGRNWAERFSFGEEVWTILRQDSLTPEEKLRVVMKHSGMDLTALRNLPAGLVVCLIDSIYGVRPGKDIVSDGQNVAPTRTDFLESGGKEKRRHWNGLDALDKSRNELLRMRFPKDERLKDVSAMLDSSHTVQIDLKQQPDQTDPDFRESQEHHLYGLCLRTTSLPLGRGMATLRSAKPVFSEKIEVPELILSGRAPNRNTKIELSHIELPQKCFDWAHFHNGVATALTTPPVGKEKKLSTDADWILSSLPKAGQSGLSPLNAGYLFGIGLNGYLGRLKVFYVHEYLVKGDPLTSMALLLGIAVAKRGTMDLQVMKMLATHLPFLLPATLLELQIDPLIQTAAVMGVGLLYAETGHHGLAEALLKEMVKTPTVDLDPWQDRQAYALSCGLALGLVTLGQGDSFLKAQCSGSSLTLPDLLVLYMNGGPKQRWELNKIANSTESQDGFVGVSEPLGDSSKGPSNHIREGDTINIHVTSPGATLALGLMFLKTANKAISGVLAPPENMGKLDEIRPDFLLLRCVARNLILWEDVVPSREWVEDQLPDFVKDHLVRITGGRKEFLILDEEDDSGSEEDEGDVDKESVCQAYANITTGACMMIALKFAGSSNQAALTTLIHFCRFYLPNENKPEAVGKFLHKVGMGNMQTCLNTIVLSLGLVMAGSGHLDVLRIVRMVRQAATAEGHDNPHLVHGTHVACHMALGLLFLGAGRYSLSTSNVSVAALLCACYPRFPTHPGDNRFHPQILRHLYVLACDQRCLIPWDMDSSEMAYAEIDVKFTDTRHYKNCTSKLKAPCILPELRLLSEVRVGDRRYWSRSFERGRDSWKELEEILRRDGWVHVFRRAGYLSHREDPLGHKSRLEALNMRIDSWVVWPSEEEVCDSDQIMAALKQWCTKKECMDAFPFLCHLWKIAAGLENVGLTDIWEIKLVLEYSRFRKRQSAHCPLLHEEFLINLKAGLEERLMKELDSEYLQFFVGKTEEQPTTRHLADGTGRFLTFYDLPCRKDWESLNVRDFGNLKEVLDKLKPCDSSSLNAVIALLRVLSLK